jgi:NTP pyrophosphatase (non-canonical NTP hydrolase)
MAINYIDWELLEVLSKVDSDVSLDDKAHKLGEEYGEFLQALLKYKGANNVSASATGNEKEHLLEELCDTMNVALDIINTLEFSDEEVKKMFSKKLGKWSNKAMKYAPQDKKDMLEDLYNYRIAMAELGV